jgi:uncharacterized protein YjiS (DUF1127 family)
MLRPITALRAATSRSSAIAKSYASSKATRRAERPGTAFEELVKAWVEAGLPRAISVPFVWLRRLQHRHELADLSPAQLRDVGLDANFVRRESQKPFWMA